MTLCCWPLPVLDLLVDTLENCSFYRLLCTARIIHTSEAVSTRCQDGTALLRVRHCNLLSHTSAVFDRVQALRPQSLLSLALPSLPRAEIIRVLDFLSEMGNSPVRLRSLWLAPHRPVRHGLFIGDALLKKVAAAMHSSLPALQHLALLDINATRFACEAFGRALASARSLRLVDMQGAELTDSGWAAILDQLHLRHLLPPLVIGVEGEEAVRQFSLPAPSKYVFVDKARPCGHAKCRRSMGSPLQRIGAKDPVSDRVVHYPGDDFEDPPKSFSMRRHSGEIEGMMRAAALANAPDQQPPIAKSRRGLFVWLVKAGTCTKPDGTYESYSRRTNDAEPEFDIGPNAYCDICGSSAHTLYGFRCYARGAAERPKRLHPFIAYLGLECGKGLLDAPAA
eukprot:TRINITY_DN81614_c0_g1_i1.p1 TRINITY_DN81614_c0_g1~~TRINITY_DN81614_c0_g1_i1.p1  ORF type:complete len:395 (+),score=37.91 TRINITY_DN81614_c0_g1_i1:63-1247(+)